MAGFNDILEALRTDLETDSALKALCLSKWRKAQMVKIFYKKRIEVGLDEYPLIFLTRPIKKGSSTENVHTCRIFYGFKQDDREAAAKEAIDFEEAIDAALHASKAADKYSLYIQPTSTVNDEGVYHPVYFGAKEVEIEQPIS